MADLLPLGWGSAIAAFGLVWRILGLNIRASGDSPDPRSPRVYDNDLYR